MAASSDWVDAVTGYALWGVGVDVVCVGVGLGAGAGAEVGGASVGAGAEVAEPVAGPGAGVGTWLPAAGPDVVPAVAEAAGESAPPEDDKDDEDVVPGGLDDCPDSVDVEGEVAAKVCTAVLANITTRPTAATRLSSATRQVMRVTRSTP
jgi:hypothetical protein